MSRKLVCGGVCVCGDINKHNYWASNNI